MKAAIELNQLVTTYRGYLSIRRFQRYGHRIFDDTILRCARLAISELLLSGP